VLTLLLVGTGMLLAGLACLALVVLTAFVPADAAGRLGSAIGPRSPTAASAAANSLVIVHFVETRSGGCGRYRRSAASVATRRSFDELSGDYAAATAWSARLNALFASGISLVANVVIRGRAWSTAACS